MPKIQNSKDYMIAQEVGHCNCHLLAWLEMAAATRAAPRPERLDIKLKGYEFDKKWIFYNILVSQDKILPRYAFIFNINIFAT